MEWIDLDDNTHAKLLQAHKNKELVNFRYSEDRKEWKYIRGIITAFVHNTGDDYLIVEGT